MARNNLFWLDSPAERGSSRLTLCVPTMCTFRSDPDILYIKVAADSGRTSIIRSCRVSFLCLTLQTFLLKTQNWFFLPAPFLLLYSFSLVCSVSEQPSGSSVAALSSTAFPALGGIRLSDRPPGKGISGRAGGEHLS